MIDFIKQDFVKKGTGDNQNFPDKEGGWSKRGDLNDSYLEGGLAKKRGVTF